MRDYVAWHLAYDDPDSDLSKRLRRVQAEVAAYLDRTAPHPVRVLSACSGDGRDLLDVLARRTDSGRVSGLLIEIDDTLAARAREKVAATEAAIAVSQADAGTSDAYAEGVPADLLILSGIMGNITEAEIEALIVECRAWCAPGATVIWTRGAMEPDLGAQIRAWFSREGFREVVVHERVDGSPMRVGVVQLVEAPRQFRQGVALFAFHR